MRAHAQSIAGLMRGTGLVASHGADRFPTFRSMCKITVYTFRVRDGGTGKWRNSRHKMTIDKAEERYGPGNYEVLESSKEMRWRPFLRRISQIFK